jgi:hypothetical protein
LFNSSSVAIGAQTLAITSLFVLQSCYQGIYQIRIKKRLIALYVYNNIAWYFRSHLGDSVGAAGVLRA